MKIRLAILESDPHYLQRVVPIFNNKFGSDLEIYSFTDIDAALNCLNEKNIDVFLSSTAFKIYSAVLPGKCGFAYLVESMDIDKIDNKKTICKFQKCDLIYKQILSIYSEQIPNITGISNERAGDCKTIIFSSPSGGVGTSTVAAACAQSIASKGYKVLYLNLETYGDADSFFSCDGQFDFSEIIYAVKSTRTNRAMKLQSTVKQDQSGVYFYSSVKIAIDMMDMTADDFITLQNEIKALGTYNYIIIDVDFPKDRKFFKTFECCNNLVMVSENSTTSNLKIDKAIKAMQIMDSHSEYAIQPKTLLIKNKCANTKELNNHEIRLLGSFPIYEPSEPSQIAKQLSLSSNILDQLI